MNKHFLLFITLVISTYLYGQNEDLSLDPNQKLRETQTRINLETNIQRGNIAKERLEFSNQINQHFGLKFFHPDSNAFLTNNNLPIPNDYEIGVGDEIQITLWGQAALQSVFIVDRNGRIFVPSIGFISVVGKNLVELKNYLKLEFGKIYSTLNSKEDKTYIDVSLVTLQSIKVQIIGQVVSPGIYDLHPFSSLITAVSSAGGIDTTGSIRNIKVLRNGEVFKEIDFYNLLIYGKDEYDFRLKEKDIIFVDNRQITVEIMGKVLKPGKYEINNNESFNDLLQFCGGFKTNASSTIEIRRILNRNQRKSDDNAVNFSYYKNVDNIILSDGDLITVPKIKNVNAQIYISGQVKNPGRYEYVDSMKIYDVLQLAGGINDPEYLKSVNLNKIDVTRRDNKTNFSNVISLDIKKIIQKDEVENIYLNNHDQITVYPNLKYLPSSTVNVFGEIEYPGIYPILKDEESLESIINRAGGFTARAYQKGIVLTRNGQRVVLEGMDNKIDNGDQINVPQIPSIVEIKGEIYNPGLISFKSNRKINEYLQLAGGLTPLADKKNIVVFYVDGTVKVQKNFFNPKIERGSTIVISKKLDDSNFATQALNFVQGISNTITQLITTYVIISQIGNVISGNTSGS